MAVVFYAGHGMEVGGENWRRVQPIAATHSANFSAGV
jgi:hypothetical protein